MIARCAAVMVGLVGACPAFGQWWWPPTEGLRVAPGCVDATTPVDLTVSGTWNTMCIPNGSSAQVNGFEIDLTTVREPPPQFCQQVLTPWERTERVGPLPEGRYTVYATYMEGGREVLPRVQVGTFDVVARCGGMCYPNCDASTTAPVLNVSDFACFLNRFAAADTYANCDGSTTAPVLNVSDFACFLNAFAAGC